MTNQTPAPDPESITRYILGTFPDVAVATADGATFFSCDPERHFPNFATIVTRDDAYDRFSDLSRPGVFRLNIGVARETFYRLVGDPAGAEGVDYTVLDRLLPHPVYAAQHYISILNPSATTFDETIRPLLAEAFERVALQYRLRQGGQAKDDRARPGA